jgi:hypothetical protein
MLSSSSNSSSSGEINKALVVLGGEEGHLKKVKDLKVSPQGKPLFLDQRASAAILGKSASAPLTPCAAFWPSMA